MGLEHLHFQPHAAREEEEEEHEEEEEEGGEEDRERRFRVYKKARWHQAFALALPPWR